MIQQANSENFESLVQDGFVIVDFYGTTCVPCKLFARILEDLDAEIGRTVRYPGGAHRPVLQGRQAGSQPCGRDAAAAGQGRDRPVHV